MSIARKRFAGKALLGVLALTVLVAGMFAFSGAAAAQETSSVNCELDPYNSVCKGEQDKDFDPGSSTRLSTEPDEDTLPFTGADVTLFAITGAALVATGLLVVRRTRANRTEA